MLSLVSRAEENSTEVNNTLCWLWGRQKLDKTEKTDNKRQNRQQNRQNRQQSKQNRKVRPQDSQCADSVLEWRKTDRIEKSATACADSVSAFCYSWEQTQASQSSIFAISQKLGGYMVMGGFARSYLIYRIGHDQTKWPWLSSENNCKSIMLWTPYNNLQKENSSYP